MSFQDAESLASANQVGISQCRIPSGKIWFLFHGSDCVAIGTLDLYTLLKAMHDLKGK